MESLSLKLSLFKSPCLFPLSSPPPIPLFGLRWVKDLSSLLPHVHFSMALKISLILSSIYHGFPSNDMMPHVTYSPYLSSLFDLLTTCHVPQCEPFNTYLMSHITLVASKNVKLRFLAEITILPFFRKLRFSRVLHSSPLKRISSRNSTQLQQITCVCNVHYVMHVN